MWEIAAWRRSIWKSSASSTAYLRPRPCRLRRLRRLRQSRRLRRPRRLRHRPRRRRAAATTKTTSRHHRRRILRRRTNYFDCDAKTRKLVYIYTVLGLVGGENTKRLLVSYSALASQSFLASHTPHIGLSDAIGQFIFAGCCCQSLCPTGAAARGRTHDLSPRPGGGKRRHRRAQHRAVALVRPRRASAAHP